jgi:hypothetical protein
MGDEGPARVVQGDDRAYRQFDRFAINVHPQDFLGARPPIRDRRAQVL